MMFGGRTCPSCGKKMNMRIVTRQAVDVEQIPVTYHNVRHWTCPTGCATAVFDFSQAYVADDPFEERRGWQPYGTPPGDSPLNFLLRIDLSMVFVVIGLVLGYAMLVAGLIASRTSLGGKIASAALLTAGALFILFHLTTKAEGADDFGDAGSRPLNAR